MLGNAWSSSGLSGCRAVAVPARLALFALLASGAGCDDGSTGEGGDGDGLMTLDVGGADVAVSGLEDASVEFDLGLDDAALADAALADAALADAALDADFDVSATPDAGTTGDASAGDAGGGDAEVPVPCSVSGRDGECIDVSECVGDRSPTPGFCPGLANIQCCTARPPTPVVCDPMDHPLPNFELEEALGSDGCPPGMVRAGLYCIDQFEAALVEVFDDGTTTSWSPYHNPGERRVRAVSLADAVPQGYISGRQAGRACAEAGKRLCTDEEWLLACRGDEDRTYPYGADRQPGVCNDARAVHPAVELFPNDPNPFARIQDACINQLPDSLARTGAHPACVTPEGIYDLMGNLHEWTADPDGTFRGGFYVDTVVNGPGCLYRTTAHNVDHWDYSTGFRCCAD